MSLTGNCPLIVSGLSVSGRATFSDGATFQGGLFVSGDSQFTSTTTFNNVVVTGTLFLPNSSVSGSSTSQPASASPSGYFDSIFPFNTTSVSIFSNSTGGTLIEQLTISPSGVSIPSALSVTGQATFSNLLTSASQSASSTDPCASALSTDFASSISGTSTVSLCLPVSPYASITVSSASYCQCASAARALSDSYNNTIPVFWYQPAGTNCFIYTAVFPYWTSGSSPSPCTFPGFSVVTISNSSGYFPFGGNFIGATNTVINTMLPSRLAVTVSSNFLILPSFGYAYSVALSSSSSTSFVLQVSSPSDGNSVAISNCAVLFPSFLSSVSLDPYTAQSPMRAFMTVIYDAGQWFCLPVQQSPLYGRIFNPLS